MLVADQYILAPGFAAVIVECRQPLQPGLKRAVLDPPIEIQQLRSIIQDQLRRPGQPVVQVFLRGGRLTELVKVVPLRHGRPIEIPFFHRLPDIGVKFSAMAHKEPVLRPVGGCAQHQAMLLRLRLQFPQDIPLRSHFGGIPPGERAFVHLETVVMLRNGKQIARAGFFEQVQPLLRVKPPGGEQGNEVFIAKFLMGAPGFDVVVKFLRTPDVHIPGVPLVAVGRHAVRSPVDKNAQLPLPEPLWHRCCRQRGPGRLVGAIRNDPVNDHQQLPFPVCIHNIPRFLRFLYYIGRQARMTTVEIGEKPPRFL